VEEILRNVPCPTLIAGPRVTETELANRDLERILYVADYTTGSLDGLPYALALAQDHDAQINLVHVVDETAMGPFNFWRSRIGPFRKQLESLIISGNGILSESEFEVQEGIRSEGLVRIARNLHTRLIVLNARRISDETVPYRLSILTFLMWHGET
jgi:nucleotide-binding universal stress UspA family protein